MLNKSLSTFRHNRFYFVGDEDLLEIIGNSKNIPRLQKHFKKMFAGVHSIKLNEEFTVVLGLVSQEGEEVDFIHPISITENPVINDWLSLLEKEMRITLAHYLAQAVTELQVHAHTHVSQLFIRSYHKLITLLITNTPQTLQD